MRLRSFFASPRSFFLAAAVGSVVALAQPSTASACSPLPTSPHVILAPRSLFPSAPLSVPKSAGLLFAVQLNTQTEAAAKTMTSIEVRSGDTVIPGSITSVGKPVGSYVWWRWLPDGETELPTGELTIEIAVTGMSTAEDTVTVDDRVIAPLTPTFTVSASRQLKADATAPKITCEAQAIANCGGTGTSEISTRAIAEAQLTAALEASEQDVPYFQVTTHFVGRTNGSPDTTYGVDGWGTTVEGRLTGQFDEFCASVTTLSLIDGTETTTDATCIQNTLDLGPLSADEENAFVKKSLQGCSNPTFPPGTSADYPTGRAPESEGDDIVPSKGSGSSDGDGCSATGTTPRSNGLVVALAVGLCALAGRRSRRVASSR